MKRISSPRQEAARASPSQNNTRMDSKPRASVKSMIQQNDLAERLELLENRIRQPSHRAQQQQDHSIGHSSGDQNSSLLASLQSPNISHHSFTFDTPSLSHSSSNKQNNNGNHNNNNSLSNLTSFSPTSTGAGQKTQQQTSSTSSLQAVSLAAENHIRKMAALEHETNSGGGASNMSNASQQTLRTSHRPAQTTTCVANQVVKETPPTIIGPTRDVPKRGNPRALTVTSNNTINKKTDKRKSTPVKKEGPAVRPRKAVAAKRDMANAIDPAADTRKRTRLQFIADGAKSSPLPNNSSNSRSNPPSRNNSNHIKPNKVPKNNAKIHDFFAARFNGGRDSANSNSAHRPIANKLPRTPSAANGDGDHRVSSAGFPSSSSFPSSFSPTLGTPSPNAQVSQWRQKYQQLEQVCQEKDAQLQAVSNNRTIMQTAVQSALKQREAELESLKEEHRGYSNKVNTVMEDLMRQQALQEAQRLRQKLAADGTRLGRIVYTRAGMRSMESWEEGTASRHLQERREKLQAQLSRLEKRQEQAQTAVEAFVQQQKGQNKENNSVAATELPTHEGIQLQNNLDALEAIESVRFHIENAQRKLYDLEQEEKRLKDEKIEHIQALKLVASEDSSRFRHRPKLHDRYVLMSLLGKGGFSEVWKAFDVQDLQEVAVKIHQLDPRWSDEKKENYTKHVSREYEIHRNVRHPRIVSLLDVFEIDNNAFATTLQYCKGTDLETLLKQEKRLPERDARAILLQLLSGMKYLSQPSADGNRPGIIHYDLKPGNILFDEHGDAKITDFGLSKIVENHDSAESMELTSQGAGTYWYLPPECFIMDENVTVRISNKVDVWSIGVIFYQMNYGRRPFGHGISQERILTDHTMLNAKEVVFPEQPEISETGKQFIRDCLKYDQALRPTIAKLCEHPYITTKKFV